MLDRVNNQRDKQKFLRFTPELLALKITISIGINYDVKIIPF